jgi:hypothetical protein
MGRAERGDARRDASLFSLCEFLPPCFSSYIFNSFQAHSPSCDFIGVVSFVLFRPTVSMLAADRSIACYDGTWTVMSVFAGFIITFFSLGIPIALFYHLYKRKDLLYFTPEEEAVLEADKVVAKYKKGEGKTSEDAGGDETPAANEADDAFAQKFDELHKQIADAGINNLREVARLSEELIQHVASTTSIEDDNTSSAKQKDKAQMDKELAAAKKVIARLGHLRPSKGREFAVNETRDTFGILYQTFRRRM